MGQDPACVVSYFRSGWRTVSAMQASPRKGLLAALFIVAAILPNIVQAEKEVPTVIEMTGTVKVQAVKRFGINMGSDSYYMGAMMKKRAVRNFEGTSYRQCHSGPPAGLEPEGFFSFAQVSEKRGWRKLLEGADATILSGPLKGTKVKIKEVIEKEGEQYGKKAMMTYFVFDRRLDIPPEQLKVSSQGLLVEKPMLDEGAVGPIGTYWASDNISAAPGDVPPGSFGSTALLLDAARAQQKPQTGAMEAFLRLPTGYQRFWDANGTWNVQFWAKSPGVPVQLVVKTDGMGDDKTVEISGAWKKFELKIPVDKVPEPADAKQNPHLTFTLLAKDGKVLLDDIEIWKDGDTNPTPFLDDYVNLLKELNPGILRRLTMGGNTMENFLKPPVRAFAFQNNLFADPGTYGNGPERLSFGLFEGLSLCEFLGSEAWFCVPGTLRTEEMDVLMEFLGGPVETPGGKLRTELGHPAPWTDSVKEIHIEIGNEAWNTALGFLVGGYNGPDYWQDLFARGKASAYYKPTIIFHAAGQNVAAGMSRRILKETPAADRYAIAVYMVHGLDPEDLPDIDTEDKMFRWLFAQPLQTIFAKGLPEQVGVSKETGVEFSQYEVNHHITGGKAPLEPRNTMVASIGGAVSITNAMLLMLRECGIRSQCFFTLQQLAYDAHGVGPVRLWGANLSQRPGMVRYRPTGLAQILANKVLGGDLVETVQSGACPTFEATGRFPGAKSKDEHITVEHPAIWSYGFVDGTRRALILVNLDTQASRPVELKFPGAVVQGTAKQWVLSSGKITDNNEFEVGEPQVALREEPLPDLANGKQLTLAPFSIRAIQWESK